jgi:chromosome partitioning protein
MQVFAFANQKGGVAKTTSAVTLAAGLARRNHRVLLVDLDPQGQAALLLGLPKEPGVYRFFGLEEPLADLVRPARPHLDLLPGDKSSEKVKRQLTFLENKNTILQEHLQGCGYEVVILDLAPSLDILHLNGLAASDWVIIPTRLDRLSIDGVQEILLTLAELSRAGKCYRGYTILPTFFERSTKETLLQFRELANTFSGHLWPPIPQDAAVRSVSAQGKTLWEVPRATPAVKGIKSGRSYLGGYLQVLDRMEELLDGQEK